MADGGYLVTGTVGAGAGVRTLTTVTGDTKAVFAAAWARALPSSRSRQAAIQAALLWSRALAGKSRGLDAGGWFDAEIGADEGPKSISHEHTFSEDTADLGRLESTLARLSEMVGRRLREHGLRARTVRGFVDALRIAGDEYDNSRQRDCHWTVIAPTPRRTTDSSSGFTTR